ncbi:PaaI family thioesterase [Nocardia miyunensis]|uniref:PaaI family thioesterase n=1 Tax=Nocardia miyunensis TaxID=282684 RepID=UPI000836DBFC|nr:PaaI family thioesterase [Nocardia miyunensis]
MSAEQYSAGAAPHGAGWDRWAAWAENMPTSQQIGLRCVSIEYGRAELMIDSSEWPLNPVGAVHGGAVIAVADHCFGIVGSTVLDVERMPATATLTADFLRPATLPLTFVAEVDRCGRTLAFITVTVVNGKGKVATKVSGTMVIDGASRHIG